MAISTACLHFPARHYAQITDAGQILRVGFAWEVVFSEIGNVLTYLVIGRFFVGRSIHLG